MPLPAWVPGAISAGANIIGGLLGQRGEDRDRKFQQQLAHNRISWTVADALRAGVHPIYALGGSGPTYSPVSGGSLAAGLSGAGQDISRAMLAQMSERERRETALREQARDAVVERRNEERHRVDMERAALENSVLRSQLARMGAGQLPPGFPEGVNSVRPGSVRQVPSRVVQGARVNPSRQPGAITGYQFMRTPDGGLTPVQSEQAKERTEDELFSQIDWWMRHRIQPAIGGLPAPSTRDYPLAPGYRWEWNFGRQAFYPTNRRRRGWIGQARGGVRIGDR